MLDIKIIFPLDYVVGDGFGIRVLVWTGFLG